MRLILTLEYDGSPFHGWAAQPGLPTVEAALRQALSETFTAVENLAVAGEGVDAVVHVYHAAVADDAADLDGAGVAPVVVVAQHGHDAVFRAEALEVGHGGGVSAFVGVGHEVAGDGDEVGALGVDQLYDGG